MKKFLVLLLALVMACSFIGCGAASSNPASSDKGESNAISADFKVGFICLHDENSTYDLNFINAAKEVQKELGLKDEQVIIKTGIPEGAECYEAAAELVDAGCNAVFADSFGHEDYMLQAAKEFTDVQFCHATGTKAHTEKLANFHNAFASIYQGRYLAGIVAGMKLNEMIDAGQFTKDEAKMGYVGAMPYAEVKSGLTSFYLGAKSVCPSVTMDVIYTSSWYDEAKEKEAANKLINSGCKLISQHADSMGAPTACEDAKVPNVTYNGSTAATCPETFMISSKINWVPYFKYMIESAANGTAIEDDYCGTLETGSVEISELGKNVAEGTQEAVDAAKAKLISGELKVFDVTTFTVGGKQLDSYKADVDSDADFTPDTEVIKDGYFNESSFRSAPYFDIDIDGITTK